MGSIRGKLEVGLYADANPMIMGFKKGEEAAKRASGSIGESIEKINKKQMKNIGAGLLGNLGILGALDAGTKIADEMVKGFQDGSIKGFGGAIEALGVTIVKNLENIPIAGALGRLIAAGVDAVSGGTMGQESAQEGSRGEFAKKQKEIAELDKGRAMRAAADKELVDRIANESAAKQKKLDDEDAKVKKFYADQRIDSEQEILKIKDDLRKASMSEREIEVERIQNLKTIPEYMKEEGIAAYDALVALRTRLDLEKQIQETKTKAHEKAQKEFDDSQQNIADADKDYQTKLEETKKDISMSSSNTDVSTALGSIKVAGTGAMNVQKIAEDSLSVQKLQLEELRKTSASLSKQLGAP